MIYGRITKPEFLLLSRVMGVKRFPKVQNLKSKKVLGSYR